MSERTQPRIGANPIRSTPNPPEPKSPRDSAWKMSMRVMPDDLNPAGTCFGGRLLSLIDLAAGVVAEMYSGTTVVTRYMSEVEFREPIYLGELVQAQARVVRVGRTSMDILVQVETRNLRHGTPRITNRCRLTFVALDAKKKPTPVPPLLLETDEDRQLHADAERLHQRRLDDAATHNS